MSYLPTIGLEIHAELKTATKMFCACRNDPDEKAPNINVCAVCLAHPGTLPAINKEAVKKVLMVGKALGGRLADYSEFDRKNYFYPDIPKGYQISQYKHPLVSGGALAGVAITRVHLEEDTARSQHAQGKSLVDYNRAGVPLMELVTEPDIHDAKAAGAFAKELQLLLRSLGVAEANMEKGEMRVEANISVAKAAEDGKGGPVLGTKVEVKNLNSFRSVERAIAYEIERQTTELEQGRAVAQETRGWDEAGQKTYSQRKKEKAHDYRYFPDPDLPKLMVSEAADIEPAALPELPRDARERLAGLGFLQAQDIEQLVADPVLMSLFAQASDALADPALVKIAANFILNDIAGQRKKDPAWVLPSAEHLEKVVRGYHSGALASPQAKQALLRGEMVAVADESALPALAQKIIDANPAAVAEYKSGKEPAMQFLIGQGMKESKGSASPQALKEALKKLLA